MHTKNFYTIGEVAKICTVNAKTLRYYDSIGLIVPSQKNSETGYRYYTQENIFTIIVVKKLQLLEFTLKEITDLVYTKNLSTYKISISQKLKDLEEKINTLTKVACEGHILLDKILLFDNLSSQEQLTAPNHFITPDMYNIKVEDIPTRTVLSTVKKTTSYINSQFSIARWLELTELAKLHKLTITGPITLTYHTDIPMEQFFKSLCTLEATLPIEHVDTCDCANLCVIPAYRGVTVLYFGDYSNIMDVHAKTLRWIDFNGYTVNGYVSEEYILSPMDFNDIGSYITKIIFPIE